MTVPQANLGRVQKSAERFYSLEACRGIAAFIVVFRHACVHAFESQHYLFLLPSPSALAVSYFFVLSGTVMELAHPPMRPSIAASMNFLLRRALRVYPLYWLMVAAMLWEWPSFYQPKQIWGWLSLVPETDSSGAPVIMDILPPAWTLHWEVFFYFFFALTLILPWRRVLLFAWLLAILLLQPASNFASLDSLSRQVIFLIINPLGLFFLSGIAAAVLIRRHVFHARVGYALLGAGIIAIIYNFWRSDFGLFMPLNLRDFIIDACGMGALTAGLMTLERQRKLRTGPWCLTLGKLSYPLYISHWLIMELVGRIFWLNQIDIVHYAYWFAAAMIISSLAASIVIAYLLDIPMQRLFRRILSRSQPIPATP